DDTSIESPSRNLSRFTDIDPATAALLFNYKSIPPKESRIFKSAVAQTNSPALSTDKIHFKMTQDGYTRRFVLSCNNGDLLSTLKSHVIRITGKKDVDLFWRGLYLKKNRIASRKGPLSIKLLIISECNSFQILFVQIKMKNLY
ncbi:hypothetical protein PFISCL1PPCAC_1602, partial [Pristionchus fissidentatus]